MAALIMICLRHPTGTLLLTTFVQLSPIKGISIRPCLSNLATPDTGKPIVMHIYVLLLISIPDLYLLRVL